MIGIDEKEAKRERFLLESSIQSLLDHVRGIIPHVINI